jgi:hypothetical protein
MATDEQLPHPWPQYARLLVRHTVVGVTCYSSEPNFSTKKKATPIVFRKSQVIYSTAKNPQ